MEFENTKIPSKPDGITIKGLKALFESINFDCPDESHYCDPHSFFLDEPNTKESLYKNIAIIIERIEGKVIYIGTPQAKGAALDESIEQLRQLSVTLSLH